ncbi:MAG: NosD domain-containing protein [Elusimicrobiales bacterium]
MPHLQGTAVDDMAVVLTQVSVKRQPDNFYWGGGAFSPAEAWMDVSFTSIPYTWRYDPPEFWINGTSYTVSVRAKDSANNWSTPNPERTFFYDTAAPAAAVTSPYAGEMVGAYSGISGTAWDSESFVSQAQVAVRRSADGLYWDGASAEWLGGERWNVADGSVTWNYSGLPSASLTAGSTYFAFTRAADPAGNWSLPGAASIFVFAGGGQASCAQTLTVKKDGSGDYTSIQAAVDALGHSLAGNACVVIGDAGTYAEQVEVRDFLTNGHRVVIAKDPLLGAAAPTLSPPGGSTAAFLLVNANVTLAGIDVTPAGPLTYGIYSSSAGVNISSITVTAGGQITDSAVLLKNWSVVENSTIDAATAHGVRLLGGYNTVAASTVTNSAAGRYALYLLASSSNSVTDSYLYGGLSHVAHLSGGSAYNSIRRSRIAGGSPTSAALYVDGSNYNSVTDSFINSPTSAYNAYFSGGAAYNSVSRSTMTCQDVGCNALYFTGSSRNTVSDSYVGGPLGYGAHFTAGSNYNTLARNFFYGGNGSYAALHFVTSEFNAVSDSYLHSSAGIALYFETRSAGNTVSRSTVTSGSWLAAAYFRAASSNTISESYLQGSTAAYISGSTGTVISNSVLVGYGPGSLGLDMGRGSRNLTFSSNTVYAGAQGTAINIGPDNDGLIAVSSGSVRGGRYGAVIAQQPAGVTLAFSGLSFDNLSPGATALQLLGGQVVSTFTGVSFNAADLGVNVDAGLLEAGSRLTMRAASGQRGGTLYEHDPYGYVDWPEFVDIIPPLAAILQPADGVVLNGPPLISGTASDDVAAAGAQVSIRKLAGGYYWNGASWTSTPVWLNAAFSTASYSWSYAGPALTNGAYFTIAARAVDSSGNWSAATPAVTVYYDAAPPVSAVTVPAPDAVLVEYNGLAGTAWDADTAVGQVWVRLTRLSDNFFWNGVLAQWTADEAWNIAAGSQAWTYAGPPEASLTTDTAYAAVSRAVDTAGNPQTALSVTTFTYHDDSVDYVSPAPFAGVEPTSLTVNWASTFIPGTSYTVRLATAAGPAGYVQTATTTALSRDFAGLTPNTFYFSYVSTGSAGAPAPLVGQGRTLAALPGLPAAVEVTSTSLAITWAANGNPDYTHYELLASSGADFANAWLSTGTARAFVLYGLPGDTPYYFKARAINADGIATAYTAAAVIATLPQLPQRAAFPSGAAAGWSAITWTWTSLANVDSYNVYYASAPGTLIGSTPGPTFSQEGLLPNATYSILVKGHNAAGEGPASFPSLPVLTLAAPPGGAALTAVHVTSASLAWALNGNPAGNPARVQRVGGPTFSTDGLGVTDTGLQGCTSYYYRIWNLNSLGQVSGEVEVGPAYTGSPVPPPPGNFSAQPQYGGRILLSWEPAPYEGIAGYRLYSDNGTGTINYANPLALLPAGQTLYTTGVLVSSAAYKFGLRAVHRCGAVEQNTGVTATAPSMFTLSGVRAAIKIPQTGRRVNGNSVTVMAELTSGLPAEVKQVRLQYKAAASAAWLDIPARDPGNHPNPDTSAPYFIHWDVTGLPPGGYDLRAVAADLSNAADPAPAAVAISVGADEPDITENSSGGKVTKQQVVNNLVANTLQAGDPASAQLAKVEIPAGALDYSTATVAVTNNPALLPPAPADAEAAGIAVEINLSNQSALAGGQSAVVTLVYPDANNDGIVDGTNLRTNLLEMYSSHSPAGPWQRDLESAVNLAAKKVTGRTRHFSFFALFAPMAANLNAARAYPVPWKPGSGGRFDTPAGADGIIFDNLPDGSDIRIYTIDGRLVRKLTVNTADLGVKVWDGRNSAGLKAASGVYLAHVRSGSKEKIIKLAVER